MRETAAELSEITDVDLMTIARLSKEQKALASTMGRDEAGELADQAANILATKNFKSKPVKEDCEAAEEDFKRASEWYSQGMLPPAHIHARAKRWVVKLFLAHWHEVAFCERLGTMPPKPYVIEHCGHIHKIEVPNYKRIEKVA